MSVSEHDFTSEARELAAQIAQPLDAEPMPMLVQLIETKLRSVANRTTEEAARKCEAQIARFPMSTIELREAAQAIRGPKDGVVDL